MAHQWVPKFWGGEEIIVNCKESNYCLKILHLMKGYLGSWHYHKIKDETFYVAEGEVVVATVELDPNQIGHLSEEELLGWFRGGIDCYAKGFMYIRNSSVRIKPWTLHRIYGLENSKIVEASTFSDDSDTYRLVPASGPV